MMKSNLKLIEIQIDKLKIERNINNSNLKNKK